MRTTELKKELVKIQKLFDKIEDIFNDLPCGMQDIICKHHTQDANLNYCIRWGQQAAEELAKDSKELVKEYNNNY